MNTILLVHLGIGALLILQSLLRKNMRIRALEDVILCFGAILLWPVVLSYELWVWWGMRKAESAMRKR